MTRKFVALHFLLVIQTCANTQPRVDTRLHPVCFSFWHVKALCTKGSQSHESFYLSMYCF